MFFLSNKPITYNIDVGGPSIKLTDLESNSIDALIESSTTNHYLNTAFNFLLITHHPGNGIDEEIILQASPIQNIYFNNRFPAGTFSKLKVHRHDFFELMFVLEGDIYQNIEYKRHYYPVGSCCLMNRNIYHQEEYLSYHRMIFLQLSYEYLLNLLSQNRYFEIERYDSLHNFEVFIKSKELSSLSRGKKYIDFIPLENPQWIKNHIHSRFENILFEIQDPSIGSSCRINALVLELMGLLFDDCHFQNTPVNIGTKKEQMIFDNVTQFMVNYHGRFRRDDLENFFNYSSDYLYKIVHKYTGLSLFDYGMNFCMDKAAVLLTTTNMSIEQIMQFLNFSNQTHFYKLFYEHFGMTPAKYRKAHT